MRRRKRAHTSDEFGRPTSGSATAGLDGPMIGAASAIIVDGIAERESGATPGPPPITVRTFLLAAVVMFLLGLAAVGLLAFLNRAQPIPAGWHDRLQLEFDASKPITTETRFTFTTTPDESGDVMRWYGRPSADAIYVIDGETVVPAEFARFVADSGGMMVSDVQASAEGVIDRLAVSTP